MCLIFLFSMVSLLKDFVESEFFLIDGDSLFITCVSNVNFKKGQTLHFFYIVEQFLHDFIQKEAKFVIVFFKDAENMYFSYPELQALRMILIQHLEHNTDVTIHTEFSNCLSPEWEIFLQQCYPYFLIVSERGITPCQTDFLNIFIIHALQKKISIVQPSGIESDVLRIYGYCASSCYSHRLIYRLIIQRLQTGHSLFRFVFKKFFLLQIHQTLSLLQNLWPEGADIRSVVCSISCSVTLKLYKKMLHKAEDCENLNICTENHNTQDLKKPPTLKEAADLCRMLCLTVVLLQRLPLFQRAKSRIITHVWDSTLSPFLRTLKKCEFFILKQLEARNNWNVNFTGLPDLTDNILWKNIAYYYEIEYRLNLELGDTLMQECLKLWNTVLLLSGDGDLGGLIPLRTTSRPFLTQKQTSPGGMCIIMYVFCFFLSDDPAVLSLSKKREFDELTHWHSARPLSDDFERTRCSSDAKSKDAKGRWEIQKLHHFYHVFGKSLIGSNRSVRIKTNAEKFIEENQKRQLAKLEKREEERWNNLSLYIEKEIKESPKSGIKRLEDFLQICPVKSVRFTAEMVGMDACFKLWMEYCLKTEAESRDISIIINLMKRIHIIHEKYSELLQNTHRQKLAKYLRYIGFDNLAHSLYPQVAQSATEKDISKYSVHMGAARFQLTYMGPYLFREERSDPDPRVQHFIPDTWQRELLDVVDNNESAVIVAPTSSGKTYASYYCMEKILREGNEGVVVYVAPTKALVNQVVGTVCNLFTKALPKGLVVCGTFTRDYRHDALNCQILVTVPQCLEILLLSPHNQKWVKRMRYVIFDEVHCLGGEIGAEVWEHLLVMIRCPFLALSATISNPEHLTEWLVLIKRYWQHVESTMENSGSSQNALKASKKQQRKRIEKSSHIVRLVWYKERYNDLEKYVCSLKDNDFLIEHYHPCAALTVNHIEKYGIPLDLGFSPRESILLYDAMVHVWPEWPRMQELEPEEFSCFKNKVVIMRADAKKYEEELKKEVIHWTQLDRTKVLKDKWFNLIWQIIWAFQTLMKILRRLRGTRQCYKLHSLLRRGIGYHHGSMEYEERQVVEMLFRLKHIKMSGRAGRRGEDLIGNVFFYDIPLPKIQRLLKSNVPKLKGQFPLSISLVLRLMLLVAKANDKEDAKAKALSVLQHSLMSFKRPKIECMLKFYFIYSLQFLVTEGYLNEECVPIGYAGLVSHLHYHEPANFVLVSLLVKGLFHKLCIPISIDGRKTFSEDVMETLVVVLANLFGRRYLPPCVENFKKKFSLSKVTLDDLPKDFAAVVEEHNNRMQGNFGSFLLTISKLADMRKEYQLPLSEIDFSGKECEDSELVSHLMPGAESRTAVSPFACLSNITDQDLFDINVAMLQTINLNVKNIPLLCLNKYDKTGRKCPLNAYALNFYKHGSLLALTLDNWLNMGDAFNLIRDFALVIQISLSELCDDEDDNVVLAFKQLSEAFKTKLWKKRRY
uniref:Helicase ATP-binding domain-containing protein n=1 Tax=Equus asinus TaxID=9793 RepID=A0A9L0ILR2_EQUAS